MTAINFSGVTPLFGAYRGIIDCSLMRSSYLESAMLFLLDSRSESSAARCVSRVSRPEAITKGEVYSFPSKKPNENISQLRDVRPFESGASTGPEEIRRIRSVY